MPTLEMHHIGVTILFTLGVVTFLFLLKVPAPYGRHQRKGWGPTLHPRAAWILMEAPTLVVFSWVFMQGTQTERMVPLVLGGIWMVHYVHRTCIFPFRIIPGKKRTPLLVALSGFAFQSFNSFLNAQWISTWGPSDASWFTDPRFIAGVALFFFGMAINLHADTHLIALRKKRTSENQEYSIPHAGFYRLVSNANYFGELLEWCGWALLTWSLAGAAFAFYTWANLAPRAIANHRWYEEKFPNYPKNRKVLIPFFF